VNDEELRSAAIEGMLESLDDPFTIYVPPSRHEAFEQMLDGSFKGVGIELSQRPDGAIEIVTPIEGSPAFEAGVLAGDVILKVNGADIAELRLPQVIEKIKGPLGSEVTLTVRHSTGEVVDLTMKRAEVVVPTLKGIRRADDGSWEYFVSDDPKIAYVRLTQFTPDSAEKLRTLLGSLLQQGMTGLIFDLRFNPGGRLDEAVNIVDLFIDEGVIVKTRGRNRPESVATAQKDGTLPNFNMVVLINEHSASASEVVSGSLLDNRRAVIIGTRSYGKGSVQEPIPLDDGGDLKLTVAYYYLPSGRLVHRKKDATDWGVEPNINVPMDETAQRLVLRGQADADVIRNPSATRPSTQPATQPIDVQLQRAVETLVALNIVQGERPDAAAPVPPRSMDVSTRPASTRPATNPAGATPATAPAD
jgi:carboxyl-terminal processing protease